MAVKRAPTDVAGSGDPVQHLKCTIPWLAGQIRKEATCMNVRPPFNYRALLWRSWSRWVHA